MKIPAELVAPIVTVLTLSTNIRSSVIWMVNGILCDIADAAMGMAFASTLAEGESFTTVELKINFFRPVWNAQLKAEAKVLRRGSKIGYVECEITDESDKLVAKSGSTCMVLAGEHAKGR